MPVEPQKPRVLLDWFTVSYRSVVAGVVLLVALLVAGRLVLVHRTRRASPARRRRRRSRGRKSGCAEAAGYPAATHSTRFAAAPARRWPRDATRSSAGSTTTRGSPRSAPRTSPRRRSTWRAGSGTAAKEVRIYHMEGDVRVKRAGEFNWESADRKMLLARRRPAENRRIGLGAADLLRRDDDDDQPGLASRDPRDPRGPRDQGPPRQREAELGRGALASTQKTNVDGSFHEVATEKVSARSEGAGEFRVSSDKESKASAVDVFQRTRCRSPPVAAWRRLESGERIRADAGGQLQAKEVLAGRPAPGRARRPEDLRPRGPVQGATTLAWETTAGHARYHLDDLRPAALHRPALRCRPRGDDRS